MEGDKGRTRKRGQKTTRAALNADHKVAKLHALPRVPLLTAVGGHLRSPAFAKKKWQLLTHSIPFYVVQAVLLPPPTPLPTAPVIALSAC